MSIKHIYWNQVEYEKEYYDIKIEFDLPFRLNNGDHITIKKIESINKITIEHPDKKIIDEKLKKEILDELIYLVSDWYDCIVTDIEINILSNNLIVRFTTESLYQP